MCLIKGELTKLLKETSNGTFKEMAFLPFETVLLNGLSIELNLQKIKLREFMVLSYIYNFTITFHKQRVTF